MPVVNNQTQSLKKEKKRSDRSTKLTLERGPWTEPYAHPVRADGLDDGIGDLQHDPHAILHRATVRVRPVVGVRLQKLIREIPVRSMDLHAVEPSLEDGILRRGRVQLHVFLDLL